MKLSAEFAPSTSAQSDHGFSVLPVNAPRDMAQHQEPQKIRKWLIGGLIVGILAQRFVVPFGPSKQLYLSLVVWAVIALRILTMSKTSIVFKNVVALAALGVLIATSTVVTIWTGAAVSMPSLLLLLVIYTLFSTRLTSDALQQDVASAFIYTLTCIAVIAGARFSLQYVGWHHTDLLASFIPKNWLASGVNTNATVTYGSPIFRENGIFFLEPSTFSQYLALAILTAIYLRRCVWCVPILLFALACTLSGTGLTLLAVGLGCAFIQFGFSRTQLLKIATIIVVGATVATMTFVGSSLNARAGELSSSNASGYYRYVAPFKLMWDQPDNAISLLFGHGAGSAQNLSENKTQGLADFTAVQKLLFEFGLIAGGIGIVFVFSLIYGSMPERWLSAALIAFFFFNGGLLQVDMLMTLHLLFGIHRSRRQGVVVSDRLARMSKQLTWTT